MKETTFAELLDSVKQAGEISRSLPQETEPLENIQTVTLRLSKECLQELLDDFDYIKRDICTSHDREIYTKCFDCIHKKLKDIGNGIWSLQYPEDVAINILQHLQNVYLRHRTVCDKLHNNN